MTLLERLALTTKRTYIVCSNLLLKVKLAQNGLYCRIVWTN